MISKNKKNRDRRYFFGKITSVPIFIAAFAAVAAADLADEYAGSRQQITLKDGQVIEGRITDIRNGFYTVETTADAWQIIHENDIKTIAVIDEQEKPDLADNDIAPTPQPEENSACLGCSSQSREGQEKSPSPGPPSVTASMLKKVFADPEIEARLKQFEKDPELKNISGILKRQGDENLNLKLESRDKDSWELMNHPKVREIGEMMLEKMTSSGTQKDIKP